MVAMGGGRNVAFASGEKRSACSLLSAIRFMAVFIGVCFVLRLAGTRFVLSVGSSRPVRVYWRIFVSRWTYGAQSASGGRMREL